MQKRKRGKQMANLYQNQYIINKTGIDINQLYRTTEVDNKFTFVDILPIIDEAYFVDLPKQDKELFLFPSLEEVKKKMQEAGYSREEIESDIQGLSELPEYDNSKRNASNKK